MAPKKKNNKKKTNNNQQNHNDHPSILAGRANGRLKPGRHIRYAQGTPMGNMIVSMLDMLGVEPEHFGDSTGKLERLSI